MRLPFEAALAGDMFQFKTDEVFKELIHVFGIADDIFISGYDADEKDTNRMLK